MLNETYDFICGIGAACPCSETLRSVGLQFESYPLDWLFGGEFEGRIDLLLNRFSNFINKEDLEKIAQREFPLPCDIYRNNFNHIVFNHDFPLNGSLNNDYSAVKEKYDRRIKRLYENIEKARKILLVYIEVPTSASKVSSLKKKLLEAHLKLAQAYPDKEFNIVYVARTKWFFPIVYKTKVSKNCLLVRTNFKNPDKNSEEYEVDFGVLKKIFKSVKLNKNVIVNQNLDQKWVQQ